MDADRRSPDDTWSPDDALARRVLPQLADLPGPGWSRDADDGDDGPASGRGADTFLLPPGFPEEALVADGDVGFRRDAGSVFALSSVFTDALAARRAFEVLDDPDVVHDFVLALIDDVNEHNRGELVGPVLVNAPEPVPLGVDGLAVHEARLASVDDDAALPVVLRLALVRAGRVLVLLWAVDLGDRGARSVWARLVARVSERVGGRPG